MAFSEELKLNIKKKSHFSCCLCHALGIEIHHIVPQAEGGPDTEDNAAPLCPTCHEIYGANPQKRKFIRETRDFWYELCADRFKGDAGILNEISQKVDQTVSKADLQSAVDVLANLISSNQKINLPTEEKLIKVELPILYWVVVLAALSPQMETVNEIIQQLREKGYKSMDDAKKLPKHISTFISGTMFAQGAVVDVLISEGVLKPEAARIGMKALLHAAEEEYKRSNPPEQE